MVFFSWYNSGRNIQQVKYQKWKSGADRKRLLLAIRKNKLKKAVI